MMKKTEKKRRNKKSIIREDAGGRLIQVIILGAGMHAKVVADVVTQAGYCVRSFLDDNKELHGTRLMGIPILGSTELLGELHLDPNLSAVVGIGDNFIREKFYRKLVEFDFPIITPVHPRAVVDSRALLGQGTVVMPQVAINVDTIIGVNCIVNTSCSIDHDCHIGAHVHIAPGTVLGGAVEIGDFTLVGLGSKILPEIKIGKRCVIGAGSVVIEDVPDNTIVAGVPARIIRSIPEGERPPGPGIKGKINIRYM
ncbi:MAG: acetyltransferase [Candidatus Eremiobacteraeota bacterium]|nr:acetyltransferase [Candidatus Eremiobacteraeota bacterium]